MIYNLDSLGDIEDEQEPTDVNELCTFESEIKNGKTLLFMVHPDAESHSTCKTHF